MCILLLFYRQIPDYPLVLCANRDEYYDRPATLPAIRTAGTPEEGGCRSLAPGDLRAGGTWIGINERGSLAAITNRKGLPVDPAAPSRGGLCAEVLACGEAKRMVLAGLETAGRERFNGFNLLVADAENAWMLIGGGSQVTCVGITPGVHVVTNEHELDAIPLPLKPWWNERPESEEALIRRLSRLLKRHDPLSPDGFSPCKHFSNRGTRSATLIIARPGHGQSRFLFADGPPCETRFDDYSKLIP
ncbi:MAG: NRDE family protein [Planctomycetota bacterium]